MSTVTVETRVTVTPGVLPVPDSDTEERLVQLWVRSSEGSWSGCLTSEDAEELARQLIAAAADAAD
jgi:hypothetical protein